MTKDMIRMAAIGTTMAGISVLRLLEEEPLLADVEFEGAAVADEDLAVEVAWAVLDCEAK